MANGFNVRVGDADREAVATQLRDHYTAGRLTLDELNERLDQAFAARTRGDLNAVTRDLPYVPAAVPPSAQGGQSGQSGWGSQAGGPGTQRRGLLAGAAMLLPALVALWALVLLGGLFAFGVGGPRPIGIIFLLAALAVLRRLFGRRRRFARGCGRRGPRW